MRASMRWLLTMGIALTVGIGVTTTTASPGQEGADLTVEESASPELVGAITDELGVTPAQAQGGAGALLGLAKTRLEPSEFSEVEGAIPGVEGLLSAAPAVEAGGAGGGLGGVGEGLGGAMGLASLAGSFDQLGLSPDMATKMVPVLTNFVKGQGATNAASLLAGALK